MNSLEMQQKLLNSINFLDENIIADLYTDELMEFLNTAQINLCVSLFNSGNYRFLKRLYREAVLVKDVDVIHHTDGEFYLLPDDFLYERVCITSFTRSIDPYQNVPQKLVAKQIINYEVGINDNVTNRLFIKQPLYVIEGLDRMIIYTDAATLIQEVVLSYIKYPNTIKVQVDPVTRKYIDLDINNSDIDEEYHDTIVESALQLLIRAKGGSNESNGNVHRVPAEDSAE